MADTRSTAELKEILVRHEAHIEEMRAIGQAWALDARSTRIAEHNARHIRQELRHRGEL